MTKTDVTDAPAKKPRRRHVAVRPKLLLRDEMDGRTNAAKVFDALVDGIVESDLGGRAVEPVGEFALKGIRRPILAYNVLAAGSSKP